MPKDDLTLKLLQMAAEVARKAYAPYSLFHVGAALITKEGSFFTGCNVENASYGLTICAERNAIFSMVAAGERAISMLAIVADGDQHPSPCGACRQVISEFADTDCRIVFASAKNLLDSKSFTIGELLPASFSFDTNK